MTVSDRVRVKDVRVLSDNHYLLKTSHVRLPPRQRRVADPTSRDLSTAAMARRCCRTICAQRTVVLVRQFRYPAYVNGYDDLLIEAAAGLLDDETPETRIRAEAEEETGYRLGAVPRCSKPS